MRFALYAFAGYHASYLIAGGASWMNLVGLPMCLAPALYMSWSTLRKGGKRDE